MSGTHRIHVIQAGAALDRRLLWENYIQAASRLSNLDADNVGNKQFGRSKFVSHAFEEMFFEETELPVIIPGDRSQAPGCSIQVVSDESFFVGDIAWSIEAEITDDSVTFVAAWPNFDGTAYWNGMDFVEHAHTQTDGTKNPFSPKSGAPIEGWNNVSLGCAFSFVGYAGRSATSVTIVADNPIKVVKSSMIIRGRFR